MNPRTSLATVLVLSGLVAPSLAGQATDPPYLSQFPSVEQVKKAMVVADPRETALRQMGAFWQLQEIIKQLSGHREFRGFTPSEDKIITAYYRAAYYIGTAIDSAYPGKYAQGITVSDNHPYMYMRTDRRFGIEGIQTLTLIPQAVAEAYLTSTGADAKRWAARAQADSIARAQGEARMAGGGSPAGAVRDDPETRQIRRCVESGRSEMQCMMEGLGKGVMGLVDAVIPGLKSAPMQGIRMSGIYPGGEKFSLAFETESVGMNCSDLVYQSLTYGMQVTPTGVRISISTQPKPIVLTVRPDGGLQGTGPTDIAGQIITGYQQGIRTWSDGRTEPISRPIFADVTRRCTIGTLGPGTSTSPLGSLSTAPAAALNMIFGSPDKQAGKPTPAGMRITGEYGSQASFDLEFRPEGVVIGCRDAVLLRPYTVGLQGGRTVVSVENGSAPFALTLGPDGVLTGSGTVRVDGRIATGSAPDGGIAYAARSASCPVGALGPAGAQLSEAEKGAAAARASLGLAPPAGGMPTGALGPAGTALTLPAPGAGATFQLESGLPSTAAGNPFTSQTFFLLDVPLDKVIKEAGVAQPAGISATKVLEQACTSAGGAADCDKLLKAMHGHEVAALRPDQTGTAQSPELPAGRPYWLFGAVITGGRKYTWHLPLVAKAGWTKVTLGPTNAVP